MKKVLLLLLLSFSFGMNAQIPPLLPPPMIVCDDDNDGFAVFDLTTRIPNILGSLNPATTTLTFHQSAVDAQTGTNPISNINSYVNATPPEQTLFIRVVDNTTGDIYYPELTLAAVPTPLVNPASLSFCDTTELPMYDLSLADSQITAGVAGSTVSYYETLADAQSESSPVIAQGYIPLVMPGSQTLYAVVRNQGVGCPKITTLTLNTHNCGDACPTPSNLTATNITDTTFTLNWQHNGGFMGMIFSRILLLPYGSPAPTAATQGGINVNGPASTFTITGLSPNSCYTVYVKKYCDISVSTPWSEPLDVCMVDCANSGQCPEIVVLHAFLDANNNGTKDTGEANFNNGQFVYQLNDSGTNQYGSGNNGSYYIYDSNPANSYDFSFAINADLSPYYSSSVTHNNVTLPSGSGSTNLYFPVVNTAPHVDAVVYLNPTGAPRPGFTYANVIAYQNLGLQTISSGTLTYTHQSNVSISSISQAGTTATANGFTFTFTNLAPFETRYITVGLLVQTIPTVSLGDLINNTVTVQVNNEVNISNNTANLIQSIVGSYDPNDKLESHGGKIVHSTFTSSDYLYYTIRFENTGTASAEFIRIEDALDAKLDEASFEMLTASHMVNTKREGNQLTWHFYNVNLPPTVTHPTQSEGYVTFRIKPKAGYAIGDIIPNFASIYFDYNPPIITDTFNTEFVQALENLTFNTNTVSLYPNPASDRVVLTNNGTEKIAKVAIYDITGKRIYTLNYNFPDTISIDVSQFAKGMYMMELISDSNLKITKKLILK